jgi:hypothetical protein
VPIEGSDLANKNKTAATNSFRVFESNLERSRAFLRIFDKECGRGQPSNDEKELLRGSLVFAVGALDAYLSDLILEVVPRYVPKSKYLRDALREIAKADPGLALRVVLAGSKQASQAEFRTAMAEWLATKSFQGPEKVAMALNYVGCSILWKDFDEATGLSTLDKLSQATNERHAIVHNGAEAIHSTKVG